MSVLMVRCGKSTCDFTWEGPPSEFDRATAEHRRAVAQARSTMNAAVGAAAASMDPRAGLPSDTHRPVVVGKRWTRSERYTVFNIVWIVMSFLTYGLMSSGFFFLFFLFPQVATSVAQPIVPTVVTVAALCTATVHAMQRAKGAPFWPPFFASLTMFGAISAVVSAGVGVAAFLLVSVFASAL
ncbi:hypothetical protein [Microbacterium enclense]|uniref:hypothetical protein n=1 Tax=Microbacterium enclense TaxID=993073 RepID=UPI003F7FACB2